MLIGECIVSNDNNLGFRNEDVLLRNCNLFFKKKNEDSLR